MKDFLKRIFLFLIFSTLLVTLSEWCISFPEKGNDVYDYKYAHFRNNVVKFNTVFIGSSRTFRHIDPMIFDSIAQIKDIRSYNLGAQATFAPEVYFLLEKLLADNKNVKTVFLELQPFNDIGYQNLFSIKSYYWMDWNYLMLVKRYVLSSDMDNSNRIGFAVKYGLSYLYRYYFGKFSLFLNQQSSGKYVLGTYKNGFLSLDEQFDKFEVDKKTIGRNHKELKDHPNLLTKRKAIAQTSFAANKHEMNSAYFEFLRGLSKKCSENGVKLIFFIPPRLGSYSEISGLVAKSKDMIVINMADPAEYPEFYQMENSFDIGHLNKKGAVLFTKYLSLQFLRLSK